MDLRKYFKTAASEAKKKPKKRPSKEMRKKMAKFKMGLYGNKGS